MLRGELPARGVVLLHPLVVAHALDGDAVLGARELVHQPVELLVRLAAADSSRRPRAGGRARWSAGSRPDRFFRRLAPPAASRARRRCPCRRPPRACAYPFTVSTRFGIRSLRRCSWFCTCAHCALIASSWLTNLLYEQPVSGSAASASSDQPNGRSACHRSWSNLSDHEVYQPAPPPPPPLPPPPNPPNPPPNPPPPPNRRRRSRRRTGRRRSTSRSSRRRPSGGPRARAAADPADDQDDDEDDDEPPERQPRLGVARPLRGDRARPELTLRALRDAADDPRRCPRSRPAPYRPLRNSGTMYSRLVSPENPSVIHCSRRVADFDPDPPLLEREQDQQAVVLALARRCRGRGSRTASPAYSRMSP